MDFSVKLCYNRIQGREGAFMVYNFDGLTFQILMVGLFGHRSGVYEVKARSYSAISFRLSGEGRFDVGGKQIVSSAGEVLFLPANMGYKVEYSGGQSIVAHLADCNYGEVENFTLNNPKLIESAFRELLKNWEDRHSINGAKAAVYGILDKISDDKKALAPDSAFTACVQYLESRAFDADLNIEDVCRAGFMSASGLQRAFNQYYGMSPKEYLTKLRMGRALTLLAQGATSVKEIAAQCGFSDEKYFSRAFKKTYGYPPSHFKGKIIL